jgi:hypothetical protein
MPGEGTTICANPDEVLGHLENGNYVGECSDSELWICHQDPSQLTPKAIWIPASDWAAHSGHNNGQGAVAIADRVLPPGTPCVFGVDY